MKDVLLKDMGMMMYADAFEFQEQLHKELIQSKLEKSVYANNLEAGYLLFCEHPHVITLGKNGALSNLLLNNTELKKQGIQFYQTNRGGDITYHGPGQIVGYPILDLEKFNLSVRKYMFNLEEVIIQTLLEYEILSDRIDGMTGVWLNKSHPAKARKICAMGVKISRYVSMHGFAFNINTDLSYFQTIVPCGIEGKTVTSLSNELGRIVPLIEVQKILERKFEEIFNMKLKTV